jgi:hypothetical protein
MLERDARVPRSAFNLRNSLPRESVVLKELINLEPTIFVSPVGQKFTLWNTMSVVSESKQNN